MKKTSKIFKIASASIMATIFGLSGNVHAANDNIFDAASSWMSQGQSGAKSLSGDVGVDFFVGELIQIGQILVGIAVATLVIVSVIMAIRWITATPDKKAKLQQQLIGLVVATFVIFGAVGIWNLVRGIMGNVESTLEANSNQGTVLVASIENQTK